MSSKRSSAYPRARSRGADEPKRGSTGSLFEHVGIKPNTLGPWACRRVFPRPLPSSCLNSQPPRYISDLRPSDLSLTSRMRDLGFGCFENLRVDQGELVLDPWPTTVQTIKFGTEDHYLQLEPSAFELKKQLIAFFAFVRQTEKATI